MNKVKATYNSTTIFIDKTWIVLVRIAQIVAGVKIFNLSEVSTIIGPLPLAQILGAVLIADVVIFAYKLLGAPDKKK